MTDRDRLEVMTANVGNGFAPDERVIAGLRASGASLIGVQELNRRQAGVVGEALRDLYPHAVFFGDSYEGRGLLSQLPIVAAEFVELVPDRPDVLARIDAGAGELTVIVGHPRPQVMRRGRVRFKIGSLRQLLLLGRLAQQAAPAVLLGDFNMGPRHPGYARLERLGLVDAYAEAGAGRGLTFPIRMRVKALASDPQRAPIVPTLPVKRFDYIWHTRELATEDAWIGPDTGSDHASVMARLVLPGTHNVKDLVGED
jgi:endonuclease/exonuclease/phosphatase (EEP) superfamily protein YafD